MLSAITGVLLLAAAAAGGVTVPTTDQFVQQVSEACQGGVVESISESIADMATALAAVHLALKKLREEQQAAVAQVISSQNEAAVSLRDGQKKLHKQLGDLVEVLAPPTREQRPEPLDTCPYGWTHHGNSCYLVPSGTTAWLTAHAKCAELDSRARLGSVHADSQVVVEAQAFNKFWIGLSQKSALSPWLWTDGTELDYTNWDQGLAQPDGPLKNERCVLIDDRVARGWHDYPCDYEFRYLCQIRLE